MGHNLAYERFAWFHKEICQGRYPNAARLAAEFEFSERTARRAIDDMEETFQAPLVYDKKRKGYTYSDPSFIPPISPVEQEEVLAVLLARKLLSQCAGGVISSAIASFGKKLFAGTAALGLTSESIEAAFSAVWHGYSPAQAETFRTAAAALLENHLLRFYYDSPLAPGLQLRTVEPHHLQHYMGTWVLLAWCRERQDWRKFMLARTVALEDLAETFSPRERNQWQQHLQGAFGIFQGDEVTEVVLRFSQNRAPWIRGQRWHEEQKMRDLPGGGLELSLPVADFREIKLVVMQFGAEVEVVAPKQLRAEIAEEARKLARLYGG